MSRRRWKWRPGPVEMWIGRVVVVAVILLVLLTVPAAVFVLARLSWLSSVVFSIGAVVAAQHTARRLPADDPARRFWWAFAVNAALVGAGSAITLATADRNEELTHGTPSLTLIGLGAVIMVVVMITYPLQVMTPQERTCCWLDMATVMVGAGALGWYFATRVDHDLSADLVNVLTGPIVMLLLVFAVAKLLISGRPPFTIWAGLTGAGAAATASLLPVLGPTLLATDRGNWYFALNTLSDALMMLAASIQWAQTDADPHTLQKPRRRPYSTLPYVVLAGTFALLAVSLVGQGLTGRIWTLLAGAAASTGLVVVRQLAAFADNVRLLRILDAKVMELYETEVVLRSSLAERDLLASRLHAMAFEDHLTGLPNRAMLHERLDAALARSRRHGTRVVVMLLDLDDFKPINDQLGHAAGDAVLCEVAQRLRDCLREVDTVARLGGDEFAIILDDPDLGSIQEVAERIVSTVGGPFLTNDATMVVGVSVGVAFSHLSDGDGDQLIREADAAMYIAKSRGKNSYELARTLAKVMPTQTNSRDRDLPPLP